MDLKLRSPDDAVVDFLEGCLDFRIVAVDRLDLIEDLLGDLVAKFLGDLHKKQWSPESQTPTTKDLLLLMADEAT
jgi:hypothetical protein